MFWTEIRNKKLSKEIPWLTAFLIRAAMENTIMWYGNVVKITYCFWIWGYKCLEASVTTASIKYKGNNLYCSRNFLESDFIIFKRILVFCIVYSGAFQWTRVFEVYSGVVSSDPNHSSLPFFFILSIHRHFRVSACSFKQQFYIIRLYLRMKESY